MANQPGEGREGAVDTLAAGSHDGRSVVSPAVPMSIARLWSWLILLFMGVAWGLSFSLAKMAVEGGGHPLGITLWQALLGAIFLGAVTLARGRGVSFKGNLPLLYLICALLGTVVPGVIFYAAARHVPAGVLSISVTLVPILTVFLAVVLRVERLALSRMAGLLCGTVAVILLVVPEQSLPNAAAVPWVLLACLASACYAAENLVIALRMPESANPFMVACGMHLVASVILVPVVLATDSFVALAWPWDEVAWAIIGLSVVNATAYSLFIYLVHRAGPVFASQVAYVVTLSGVLWGMAIFGEVHSAWVWLSLVVMLVGLAMVTPKKAVAASSRKP